MNTTKSEYYPFASEAEKQEYYSVMDDVMAEEIKFEADNQKITDSVITELKLIKSEEWFKELFEYAKESGLHNPFVIVKEPKGQWQEEDYDLLGGVWVDQSTSYPCEDCYYGTVTVKIDEKRYLEMPFN